MYLSLRHILKKIDDSTHARYVVNFRTSPELPSCRDPPCVADPGQILGLGIPVVPGSRPEASLRPGPRSKAHLRDGD